MLSRGGQRIPALGCGPVVGGGWHGGGDGRIGTTGAGTRSSSRMEAIVGPLKVLEGGGGRNAGRGRGSREESAKKGGEWNIVPTTVN